MYQVDEILNLLNEKLGSEQLEWKGDHTSVQFDNTHIVDLIKIDTQTIELVHIIEKYAKISDAELTANMLMANYQGAMTGAARLSMTPDQKTLALCLRLDVRWVDAALFEELMTDFMKYVEFWNSAEANQYLQGENAAATKVAEAPDENAFYTKV